MLFCFPLLLVALGTTAPSPKLVEPIKISTYFSPEDKPAEKLCKLIEGAKKTVHAAIYMLTENSITKALVQAKARNVDVKIVLDKISIESPWGKSHILEKSNVKLYLKTNHKKNAVHEFLYDDVSDRKIRGFSSEPIMHNKYAIIDDKIVWTGSFNWTFSANFKNNENVLVVENCKDTVKKYQDNFENLLKTSVPVTADIIEKKHRGSVSIERGHPILQAKAKKPRKPRKSKKLLAKIKKPKILNRFVPKTPGPVDQNFKA